MRSTILATAAALTMLALAGCSSAESAAAPTPTATKELSTLYGALRDCNLSAATPGFTLGDAEMSLVIDTAGDDDAPQLDAKYEDALCVLEALDVPDATLNLIQTTRALDGRQDGTWGDVDATWSYHPDSGLNMTLQATS
jgi:hypothetical protein